MAQEFDKFMIDFSERINEDSILSKYIHVTYGTIDKKNTEVQEDNTMMITEKMKAEAIERLEILTSELGLNSNAVNYFKQGKIYYSYLTGGGIIGSIDTIGYIPKYEEIVKEFEEKYNCLVYHAIEDSFGMLSLLYVSDDEEEWAYERPEGKYLYVNTYSFDREKLRQGIYEVLFEEFGSIVCESLDGAIVRVG